MSAAESYASWVYLGFEIKVLTFTDYVNEVSYYPVIYQNQTWVWEFGCQFVSEEHALAKSMRFIDLMCNE
jgi:hypothetical protein